MHNNQTINIASIENTNRVMYGYNDAMVEKGLRIFDGIKLYICETQTEMVITCENNLFKNVSGLNKDDIIIINKHDILESTIMAFRDNLPAHTVIEWCIDGKNIIIPLVEWYPNVNLRYLTYKSETKSNKLVGIDTYKLSYISIINNYKSTITVLNHIDVDTVDIEYHDIYTNSVKRVIIRRHSDGYWVEKN